MPQYRCARAPPSQVLPEKPLSKYRQYILRSFVEDNPYIRWCPSPHCNKAIECKDIKRLFVQCLCGHKFCFICLEEAHAPVKCEKLRLWRKKEKGESENAKWLYANTKACPACESPIQKNDGCNHMVCRTPALQIGPCRRGAQYPWEGGEGRGASEGTGPRRRPQRRLGRRLGAVTVGYKCH